MISKDTIHDFKRTHLGEQELLQRKLRLSARIRTLLLLLESDDLKQLSHDAFEKIASSQNYQTLLDLNLIENISTQNIQTTSSISTTETTTIQPDQLDTITTPITQHPKDQTLHQHKIKIQLLNFGEIKTIMQQTLKQYCGLMAKNLILAIENAHSTHDIRQYQGKWLTTLFETRISRQQLNELLQVINQSMDNIEALN
ncbi:MAG: hypothetical protein E6Q25_04030 [Acinetobacter sp.]|nr:MAG: hypothetical protein E6Q25_04030 [Acinetobacter sp.]